MKFPRLAQVALSVAVLTVAAATVSSFSGHSPVLAAQNPVIPPAPTPGPPGGAPPHEMPAPTNLQILPKNLTGKQVHDIMDQWEGELGAHCNTCHAPDPNRKSPNGRPMLNFADDSKEDKRTARLMYKMMEDINANYVSKVPNSGAPVTCGTCHRGHLGPEPFAAASDHDHDHAH